MNTCAFTCTIMCVVLILLVCAVTGLLCARRHQVPGHGARIEAKPQEPHPGELADCGLLLAPPGEHAHGGPSCRPSGNSKRSVRGWSCHHGRAGPALPSCFQRCLYCQAVYLNCALNGGICAEYARVIEIRLVGGRSSRSCRTTLACRSTTATWRALACTHTRC